MIFIKPWSMERLYDGTVKPIARMSQTRANSWASMFSDFAISVALLTVGIGNTYSHPVATILTIVCGLIIFTLIEYCFHRWLFHGPIAMMETGHRKHHDDPLGYDSLPFFLPPLILLALLCVLALFIPTSYALLLVGGVATGYAIYGLSHLAIHITRFRHPLVKRWAAIHYIHHHHPDKNFGVTTPLWDIILRTRYVPARHRD